MRIIRLNPGSSNRLIILRPAQVLLKANGLQLGKRYLSPSGKAGFSLLLAALVLLLNAMAACPALHELIHRDASAPGHHCVVTLFALGQVDSAGVEIAVIPAAIPFECIAKVSISVFAPVIENLPAGRAPPVSVSSPV